MSSSDSQSHNQETTGLIPANTFTNHSLPSIPNKFCNTTAMAKHFSDSTSAMLFVLLVLAACIMPTSSPTLQTVYVHQATSTAFDLNSGLRLSVSFTCQMIVECMMLTYDSFGCCIPFYC